jgi:hypothetical protein
LDSNRVVTADVDLAGNLSVNVWGVGIAGQAPVYRQGSARIASDAQTGGVGIVALSSTEVATIDTDPSGNYRVQAWSISSEGVPTAQGSAVRDKPYSLSIVAINSTQVVTAVDQANANMEVAAWSISSSGAVTLQSSVLTTANSGYTAPGGMALAPLGGFLGSPYEVMILTSIASMSDTTILTDWLITSSGSITKGDTGSSTLPGPVPFAVAWSPNYFPFTIGDGAAVWGLTNESWSVLGSSQSGAAQGGVAAEGVSSSNGLAYYVTAGTNHNNSDVIIEVWSTPIT